VLQQTVREPAGGGAHVERYRTLDGYPELLQCRCKLQSSPAYIGKDLAENAELCVVRHEGAGLVLLLAVHQDLAGQDQGLPAFAAFHKPAVCQQPVDPDLTRLLFFVLGHDHLYVNPRAAS